MTDFKTVALREVLRVRHGKSQRGVETPNGRFPILGTGGQIGRTDIPLYSLPSVLIGRKGTIDRPQFFDTPFWTVDTLFYTEIDTRLADPKYLYYQFLTVPWSTFNEASGVPSLSSRRVEQVKVPLPDLETQRQIAIVLSGVDELIRSLLKLIAKKKLINHGMTQQLLTSKTRLPGYDTPWYESTLGEISRIKTGKRNNQDKRDDGQYPFYVRSQTIERIDSYSYDCEAILVPGEGNIGSIFHYVNGKFEVHQRVYKISDFADKTVGKFVFYFMRQFFGLHAMENSVKATVDSLRLPTFKSFKIRLPSRRDEQESIVTILDHADAELAALELRLATVRDIKRGMMQELLTGRTRLTKSEVSA